MFFESKYNSFNIYKIITFYLFIPAFASNAELKSFKDSNKCRHGCFLCNCLAFCASFSDSVSEYFVYRMHTRLASSYDSIYAYTNSMVCEAIFVLKL